MQNDRFLFSVTVLLWKRLHSSNASSQTVAKIFWFSVCSSSAIDPVIISRYENETEIETSWDKKPWNAAGFMWKRLRADFTTLDRIKFPLPWGGTEAQKICVCSRCYALQNTFLWPAAGAEVLYSEAMCAIFLTCFCVSMITVDSLIRQLQESFRRTMFTMLFIYNTLKWNVITLKMKSLV